MVFQILNAWSCGLFKEAVLCVYVRLNGHEPALAAMPHRGPVQNIIRSWGLCVVQSKQS